MTSKRLFPKTIINSNSGQGLDLSGSEINVTGLTFVGMSGGNVVKFPSALSQALLVQDTAGSNYVTFDSRTGRPSVRFGTEVRTGGLLAAAGGVVVVYQNEYNGSPPSLTASCASNNVTGVGTTFTAGMVGGLIYFRVSGLWGIINARNSDTSLSLDRTLSVASPELFTIYYGNTITLDSVGDRVIADAVRADTFDAQKLADTLSFGTSLAGPINISKSGSTTTIKGGLEVKEGVLFDTAAGFLNSSFATAVQAGTLGASNTVTLPTATTTLVGTDATQTLSNKTVSDVLFLSRSSGQVTFGDPTTNLVLSMPLATLTPSTSVTLTLPHQTDTLIARATADTLTNKILTGNTLGSFISNSVTFTMPTADGSISAPLTTNGSGALSFSQTGLTATGTMSTSDLKSCFTTPVQWLPAPGAGKSIIVECATIELVNGTTKFTGGGNPFLLYGATYSAVNTASNIFTTPANLTTNSSVSTSYMFSTYGGVGMDSAGGVWYSSNLPVASNIINKAICFSMNAANLATGNGSVNWWIKYSIVTNFS